MNQKKMKVIDLLTVTVLCALLLFCVLPKALN